MRDKLLEQIEAIAEKEFKTPIDEVMRRGIDALARELGPVDLYRFIVELRHTQSGLPEARRRLYEGKSMEQIRKEQQKFFETKAYRQPEDEVS